MALHAISNTCIKDVLKLGLQVREEPREKSQKYIYTVTCYSQSKSHIIFHEYNISCRFSSWRRASKNPQKKSGHPGFTDPGGIKWLILSFCKNHMFITRFLLIFECLISILWPLFQIFKLEKSLEETAKKAGIPASQTPVASRDSDIVIPETTIPVSFKH